jgi:hypothetical protein
MSFKQGIITYSIERVGDINQDLGLYNYSLYRWFSRL